MKADRRDPAAGCNADACLEPVWQPASGKRGQALVEMTFADTVFFTNSGAEAVECAIKTARAYHQHRQSRQI
jgi:acetylornithine/succinyldiaminopimelate/putrescine aminotransferase